MKKTIFYLLVLILTITNINIRAYAQKKSVFIDQRDGNEYKTIKIGTQVWMAENLAYNASNNCWPYENNLRNIGKYGYLYNYKIAKNICPSGWRLPTKREFETLLDNFGGEGEQAFKALISNGNSNFSALYAGMGGPTTEGPFVGKGFNTFFWSATIGSSGYAWYMGVNSYHKSATLSEYSNNVNLVFSVRCIKN